MENRDSFSITPPRSPATPRLEQEGAVDMAVVDFNANDPLDHCLFHCQGEVCDGQRCHPDSFLRNNVIRRLIEPNVPHNVQTYTTISLFSYEFMTELSEGNTKTLLNLARKQIMELERMTSLPNSGHGNGYLKVREGIREYLSYIYCQAKEHPADEHWPKVVHCILKDLHALLLYMGRIIDLSSNVLANAPSKLGNKSTLAAYHLFHLHLEFHWSVIETLHVLTTRADGTNYPELKLYTLYGEDALHQEDILLHWLLLLLWDIVILAMQKHQELSFQDYLKISPFQCSCVKELLIMIIHVLQDRQQKMAKQSFWVLLSSVLPTVLNKKTSQHSTYADEAMEIDTNVYVLPPDFECKDPLHFCWWFVLHLAQLYQYGEDGQFSNKTPVTGNYYLVQAMVKKSLLCRENQLRWYLRCCVKISILWEANTTLLASLWDYFYKRINDQFHTSEAGLGGYACIDKSAIGMFDRCQNLEKDLRSLDQDNSYSLFLRLISIHLGKSGLKGPENKEWKQLKGRFFSKFHPRKVQELTDVGINNLCSLFLILASVVDLENSASKLCDLLSMLDISQLDTGRRCAVWRGTFSLVLLCVGRQSDVSFLTTKLVSGFDAICKEMHADLDSIRYSECWKLLSLYLDSTQDVIESSQSLSLGQPKLIGEGFKNLLTVCRENELRILLDFALSILTKYRIISSHLRHSDRGSGLSHDYLWSTFYPFVKEHSKTQTPPNQLADLAAGFALLILDNPPGPKSAIQETVIGCISYFGWEEVVNVRISCRFLCHILPNQQLMEKVTGRCKDLDVHVIQAWFRSAWYLTGQNDQTQELTRLVLRLSPINDLFHRAEIEPADSYDAVIQQFVSAVGKGYSLLQNFKEKLDYKKSASMLFGDVMKHVNLALKNWSSSDLIRNVYRLAGHVVKHCSSMIYIRTSHDCLLPALIDRLILPRSLLTTNKPLPTAQLSAIREYLHLFLEGLSKLDYRGDSYIQRRIKDIVSQYLHRFPILGSFTSGCNAIHPLLTSLHDSCRNVSEEQSNFRGLVLETVRAEYLQSSNSSQVNVALSFISKLHEYTDEAEVLARDTSVILPPVLQLLLVTENTTTRQYCTQILQSLMEACKVSVTGSKGEELKGHFRTFVSQQIRVFQGKALKVIEMVSVLHPDVISDLIPSVTQAVKDCEAKRGVGIDKQLRFVYSGILRNLGERGQVELTKLLTESV